MGRICVKYHKSFPYRKYLAEVPLLYFQTDIEQVSCIGFGQFIGTFSIYSFNYSSHTLL